jgi:hypothetical protein
MDNERPETEGEIDSALEDTFPASDPPATGGTTGPNDTGKTPPGKAPAGNDPPLAQGVSPAQY